MYSVDTYIIYIVLNIFFYFSYNRIKLGDTQQYWTVWSWRLT